MQTDHHTAAAETGEWRGILHELAHIAGAGASLGDGLDAAVEVMGTRLGCPLGFVYLVREGGGLGCHSVWVANAGRKPMHPDPDRPVDFSLPLEAMASGTVQWAHPDGSAAQQGSPRQAVAFPVLALTEVVAVLELVGEGPVGKLATISEDAHLIGVLLGRLAGADQIAEAVSRERRRIARELHDNIGQQLSGLGMYARSLANGKGAQWQELRDQLDLLATGLKEAHVEVRALSHDLAAGEQRRDEPGLAAALASFTERAARRCGTVCSFTGDATLDVSDPAAATHLLRIAQEAVSNAVRHGHAQKVEVDLRRHRKGLTLQIRDDGCGIAPAAAPGGGIGIANMRARALEVGADLSIRSDDHSGTVVTCSLRKGAH